MLEILRQVVPLLIAAIILLIAGILAREAWVSFRKRRWQKQRDKCFALLGNLEMLSIEELLPLTLKLKKSFPSTIVESVLDHFGGQADSQKIRAKLAEVYEYMGFVEKYILLLQDAKAWPDRANAAEKMGNIGHARAVLPLISTLLDAQEDPEVKDVAMRALGRIRDPRAIPPLIESLGLPDPSTGQPLADVLIQYGNQVAEPLIKVIGSSPREMQRYWAARIFGALKNSTAVPVLINALSDHSARVRGEVAHSLGLLEAHEGISSLSRILFEDPVAQVREAAAEALGKVADDRALEALQQALHDVDYETRRRAMEALERMGRRATPFFMAVLQEDAKEAATQAANALERLGLVSEWIEGLSGEDWKSKVELLNRVGRLGVVETMARSLPHPELSVRIRLCRILSQAPSPRTFEALTDLAQKDTEWLARIEALLALIRLSDIRTTPLIGQSLQKEEEPVRERLLLALQNSPTSYVAPLVNTLVLLLQDGNSQIRSETVKVLGRVHSPEIFQPILACLSDPVAEVREEAAHALVHYPKEGEGVQSLLVALRDPDESVRKSVIKTLSTFDDPLVIPPLVDAFEWADDATHEEIARALADLHAEDFFSIADMLMGRSHPRARVGIARTMGKITDEKVAPFLAAFMKDAESTVRAIAARALGKFQGAERASLLLQNLLDPSAEVREATIISLGELHDPQAISNILPLLDHEPDHSVCCRMAITLGMLTGEAGFELQKAQILSKVRGWVEKSQDASVQAAGWIALALCKDELSFGMIVRGLQDPEMHSPLAQYLKDLPSADQARFFRFLSFDPNLFWKNKTEENRTHYLQLLQSSQKVSDRAHAIEALAALGEQSALPVIESAFAKDPSPQVRSAAFGALGKFLRGERLMLQIQRAVQDPSDLVKSKVIPMLQMVGPQEWKTVRANLVPLLDGEREDIRKTASELLARLYHNEWEYLADQLMGTDKKNRLKGLLYTLGLIADPKAASLFIQFLKNQDTDLRTAAAEAAATASALTRQEWVLYLEDPQENVRLAAMRGISVHWGPEILEILSKHLEDPSALVRRHLALLLGTHRLAQDERPKKYLRQLQLDENPSVKLTSLLSLFRLGETGLRQPVSHTLSNLEKEECQGVLETARKDGFLADMFQALTHSRIPLQRKEALELLGVLDIAGAVTEITASLQDPSPDVRISAVETLGQLDDPGIQNAISALAQDPIEGVRLAVKRRRMRLAK